MTQRTKRVVWDDLAAVPTNCVPLSPIGFLRRSADIRPNHSAVIYGERLLSWADLYRRCCQLADSLTERGINPGMTVATILPNVPAMYEVFFGVPMAGAVLAPLNTRLDASAIAYALQHSGAKLVLVDPEFALVVTEALGLMSAPPSLVVVSDPDHPVLHDLDGPEYEDLISEGRPKTGVYPLQDEWYPITLNYTSGTSGHPKGVVYTHRGAYLNAVGNILTWSIDRHPVYLWTLPMFHASGWCFPWTMAALGGTNICVRRIDPRQVFELIQAHGVTHFCAAPVVHAMLLEHNKSSPRRLGHKVDALVAGAAPPASVIEGMGHIGIRLTHVYGLTETYGPCTYCEEKIEWRDLPPDKHAAMMARQGVRAHMQEGLEVMDPGTMKPVPADGETLGEIMFRGNLVMAGYLNDPVATETAFAGGWFHTGDLAVRHPDGWVEIRDRAKDIIISGGENIASMEIEEVLYDHPSVMFAAVVAMSDDHWGEVPCAFIELKPGAEPDEAMMSSHCRGRLAGFKQPKKFIFGELPKTSTGKIQKFALRTRATDLSATALRNENINRKPKEA